jgi:hypothetical protein
VKRSMDWTGLIEVELEWKQSSNSTVNTVPLVECQVQKKCPAVQSATPASLVTTSNELSLELRFSISKSVSLRLKHQAVGFVSSGGPVTITSNVSLHTPSLRLMLSLCFFPYQKSDKAAVRQTHDAGIFVAVRRLSETPSLPGA